MNEHHPEALLLKPAEAEAVLRMGARTLWSLTHCDAIPSRRIGRSVRYCPRELQAWVRAGCPTEPGAGAKIGRGA